MMRAFCVVLLVCAVAVGFAQTSTQPSQQPATAARKTGAAQKKTAPPAALAAQQPNEPPPPPPAEGPDANAPTPCAASNEIPDEPEVVGCVDYGKGTKFAATIPMNAVIERGSSVTVPIRGLAAWVKRKDAKTGKDNDPRSLRLYLAGHLLSNPEPSLIQVQQGYLNFELPVLSTSEEEKKSWIHILNETRRHPDYKIPISVGTQDKEPFASNQFIVLQVYPRYAWIIIASLVVLLIALFVLGYMSDLLRDSTAGHPMAPARSPLSLGRVQMAWWFYLVVASYIFIWLVTREINGLSPTVLALIGISAGTGVAAIFVDQQKLSDEENKKVALQSERGVVQARIAELAGAAPAPGTPEDIELQAKRTRLQEITQMLTKFPAVRPVPVSGGLRDLIRDGDGISFHRFQIVVWSIVLGLVFVRSVSRDLIMPDFDTTLLGLMGISSGTYIGFKFPEKSK